MSLWRKIVNVFVETEEEVIEDEGKQAEPVREAVKKEPVQPKKEEPVVLTRPKQPEVKKEAEGKKEEKKSIFINESRPAQKENAPVTSVKETPKEKKEPQKTNSAMPQTTTLKNGYEFRPVISPMFGVNETEVITKPVTNIQTSPVHNSSVLGTIVSPIYGLTPKEEIPQSIQEDVREEDIQNFSLDDLLEEKEVHEEKAAEEEAGSFTESIHLGAQKLTDKEAIRDLKEELSYDKEPTIQDILSKKEAVKEEVPQEKPEEKEEQLSMDFEARTAEIRKAMQEFKEEDYFEREKQPTLFDFKD